MKQRIVSVIVCLAMLFTMLPAPTFAVTTVSSQSNGSGFAGGSGTATDPYLIETKEHLNNVRNDLGAHYKMVADIVFTDTDFTASGDFYNAGQGWAPIGTDTSDAFTGTFDGAKHTITGLQINITSSQTEYAGLFGFTRNATISNIVLVNADVYVKGSYACVGGVAGYTMSTRFEGCESSGTIESSDEAGGVVGYVQGGSITNCHNSATVISSNSGGGIVGATDVSVLKCSNTGDISSIDGSIVGGIVGYLYSGGSVTLSYNTGNISAIENRVKQGSPTTFAGGICGESSGSIRNCFNIGTIYAEDAARYAFAGGIAGSGNVYNCYNIGNVSASASATYYVGAGGIVGDFEQATDNCYYVNTCNKGSGRGTNSAVKCTPEEMCEVSTYTGFDFTNIWEFKEKNLCLYPTLIDNPYWDGEFAGGAGTEEDPYLIKTKKHLNNVRNYLDAHYKMDADIVFTDADFAEGGAFYNDGAGWEPIGINNQAPFSGVFDGNGRTISGLYISISTTELFASYTELYVGLFGYATGTIQSLSLDKVIYSVYDNFHAVYVGGLVGYSTAKIKNVSVVGQIAATSGSERVYVAGISGLSQGSLDSSHFDGAVTGKTTLGEVYAAGIAGQASVVTNSNNAGSVSAMNKDYAYAGGISGYGGNISKCYNEGTIKADNAGGISGSNSTINQCYNKGNIASAQYAGGILGKIGQVSDCYNLGNVSAELYAGGIVGHLTGKSITNCYNLGEVTGLSYVGGIAGGNHGTVYSDALVMPGGEIRSCYYVDLLSAGTGRGGDTAVSCSCSDLKKQSTFSGFDFTNIWTMSGNACFYYPELVENVLLIDVVSFELIEEPVKKEYLEGKETLDLRGAVGQITYDNGMTDTVEITSGMVSGFDNTKTGMQILTVLFGEKKATFEVEIIEKSLSSIAMNTLPNQVTYLVGVGQLSLEGATITLSYNNGSTEILQLTDSMVLGFDNTVVGDQVIEVSYGGAKTYFTVTICEKDVDNIIISIVPTKRTYIIMAEALDVSGGILTVYYNNGTNEEIAINASMVSGFDNSILGSNEITISYGGKSAVYTVEIVENTRDYLKGAGTEDNPYVISTIGHLNNIQNHPTSYFLLANDITFDPESEDFPAGWQPFAFKGYLDGQGFKISNLRITENKAPGLFSTNDGTIKNLTIDGASISITNYGGEFGGFFCTENSGDIINCHSKGCTISITNVYRRFGGIAGNNSGSITNCTSSNSITWESEGGHVGGIVSTNTGIIENCTNWTSIVNNGAEALLSGGIAAKNSGTIRASKNLANITAKRTSGSVYSAGIVAEMTGGSISQCYSTGNVSAEVAQYNNSSVYAGGIVANITSGQISDCYSSGDVNGKSQATASSSASTYVGGIVGYNNTISDISNCYTVGTASGSARSSNLYVGYVCGYNATNTIENCYYLGVPDNGSGSGDFSQMYGKVVTALKEMSTYNGFDFDNTWTMEGNGDYPFPELIAAPMVYEKEIQSISIESMPSKLKYIQNYELLDVAGGALKITYAYDEYDIIPLSDATLSGFDNSVIGMQSITVSYLGNTTEFQLEIVAKSLERIEVTTPPSKVTYFEGDAFSSAGMIVTAYYNDETSEPITRYAIDGYSATPGTKTIVISYGGKSTTFTVTVEAKILTGISVITPPTKVTYLEGAQLDTTGLKVQASYNNGTTTIITDYTLSGYSSTPGTKTVVVSYGGKTATFTVTVEAKTLTGISVVTPPQKLTYVEGEALDAAGLIVKASYNNGTYENVTAYSLSGFDTNKVGQQTITISYGGKTATFTVTVKSAVPDSITSNVFTVSDGWIRKISAGTTVADIVAGINEKEHIKVFSGDREVPRTALVGTGMMVKLMDGNTVKATATVVVTGDINGDGKITITDMIAVKSHVLKKSSLTGAAAQAADTSKDGGISITDFIQIKAFILGKGSITAN